MYAFCVKWRSVRQHREFEAFAAPEIGAAIAAALTASGGQEVWQAGTLWKCPGCQDRTLKTEEFLEGMRRAELWLQRAEEWASPDRRSRLISGQHAALEWIQEVTATMFGCERDRVYLKDEDGACTFGNASYYSRI